jgi:uncharacterized protein YjeT (DUF2065 family)
MTLWLSLWLGLWFIAAGFGALLRGDRWRDLIDELERSPGLALVTGALAFTIGAVIVTLHNLWTDPAAITVSLVGWASVVEGVVLLAVPDLWVRVARPLVGMPRLWGGFALALGALLLAVGFAGRADPLLI